MSSTGRVEVFLVHFWFSALAEVVFYVGASKRAVVTALLTTMRYVHIFEAINRKAKKREQKRAGIKLI